MKLSDFSLDVYVFNSVQEGLSRLFIPPYGLKNHDGFLFSISSHYSLYLFFGIFLLNWGNSSLEANNVLLLVVQSLLIHLY